MGSQFISRRIAGVICFGVTMTMSLTNFATSSTHAQQRAVPGQSANGQLLDGLFRGILETQLERERQRNQAGTGASSRVSTRTPNLPAQGEFTDTGVFSRPPSSLPSIPRTAENTRSAYYPDAGSLRSFQGAVDGFAQQIGYLRTLLQARANNLLELRPLLPDLMRIKASADTLSTISRRAASYTEVYNDYLELDWQWRNLSYRLHHISGLDANTQQTIRQLDAYGDQIVDILGIEPQFDRQTMLEQMTMARSFMATLLDDLRYEIPASPQREAIINEGRQLQEQIRREADFVRAARYDEIVPRYTEFVASWRRFSAKLFPYKNARLNRQVSQIRKCGEEVYRLLWMPAPLDRNYLGVVASFYDQELHDFLSGISVRDLAQLNPNQRQDALAVAGTVEPMCTQFAESVRSRATIADLTSQFQNLSRERERLFLLLGPVTSDALAARRLTIEAYDRELRELLQVPEALDLSQAVQLASAIEGLAETLKQDVHRYGPYYQDGTFRNQAYQAVDTFYRQAQQLNSALANGVAMDELRDYGNTMLSTWDTVMRIVAATPRKGLDTSRFQRLDQTRQDITPLMAELATMVTI